MVVCFLAPRIQRVTPCQHSTLDDTTGVSSVLLPLRYKRKVMASLCGLMVGSSSPGGDTRVPFYLVGDVVAY